VQVLVAGQLEQPSHRPRPVDQRQVLPYFRCTATGVQDSPKAGDIDEGQLPKIEDDRFVRCFRELGLEKRHGRKVELAEQTKANYPVFDLLSQRELLGKHFVAIHLDLQASADGPAGI
jgi:hypothetical protein